jgi:hypothetical protein
MEVGVKSRPLLLILGLVLLLRLPFLNQAVQGDDPVYLAEASHAQIEPLHPENTGYVFRGRTVDLRGLTHPPMDGWILAGLLAVFGTVKEIPFHAAYIAFSLIAAAAMWSLARRFSARPVWATRRTSRSWPSGWPRSRCSAWTGSPWRQRRWCWRR